MKTIEERAKEYSLKDFDGYYAGWEKDVEEAYIAGATEQRNIDIMRVRQFLERESAYISSLSFSWSSHMDKFPRPAIR